MSRISALGLSRFALVAAASLGPALVTYVMVRVHLDSSVGDFVPGVWNDQTGYWHYILSFSEVGFASGYYTPNEHPAAVGFIHYDVHGPLFQMLYGAVASVVGWDLDTSIYFNMVVIGLGLALFCLAARLDRRQIVAVAVLGVTFWPIMLYIPTSSQESLHQAVAMGLAAVGCALIARAGELSRAATAGVVGLVLGLALIRLSWALLVFPFLLLATRRWSWASFGWTIAGTAVLVGAVSLGFAAIKAPGGSAPLDTIGDLPGRPVGTTVDLLSDAWTNLGEFYGGGIEGLQAAQITALVGLAALMVARLRRDGGGARSTGLREWLFHLLNLGTVVVASLFLYLPAGYHRLMAAQLLLSLLVMVKFRHFWLVGAVVATNLLAVQGFLDSYRPWQLNFRFAAAELSAQRAQMTSHVRYERDAPSPWCNTLLLPVSLYDVRVTLVPAGIGVSYVLDAATRRQISWEGPSLRLPIRSRYVLLGPVPTTLDGWVNRRTFTPLGSFPFGRLYENRSLRCG